MYAASDRSYSRGRCLLYAPHHSLTLCTRPLQSLMGLEFLQAAVDMFGADHEYTKLVIDMSGEDPDDCYSKVPCLNGCISVDHACIQYCMLCRSTSRVDNHYPDFWAGKFGY